MALVGTTSELAFTPYIESKDCHPPGGFFNLPMIATLEQKANHLSTDGGGGGPQI